MKKYYIAMAVLVVFSLAAVGAHYFLSYDVKEDEQKVSDISQIQTEVEKFASINQRLPHSLPEIKLTGGLAERSKNYTYNAKSTSTFEICATFRKAATNPYSYQTDTPSNHAAGYQCFKTEVYSLEPQPGELELNLPTNE